MAPSPPQPAVVSLPTTAPSTTILPEAGRVRIGTAVPTSQGGLTVHRLIYTYEPTSRDTPRLTPGNKWVLVEVTIENARPVSVPYSAGWFRLRDAAEVEYRPLEPVDHSQALGAGALLPGERAHGWMLFQLPETAAGLRLQYETAVVLLDEHAR